MDSPEFVQYDHKLGDYHTVESPSTYHTQTLNGLEKDPNNPDNSFIYHGTPTVNTKSIDAKGIKPNRAGVLSKVNRATTYHNHTYDLAFNSAKEEARLKNAKDSLIKVFKSSVPTKELKINNNGDILLHRGVQPHEIVDRILPKINYTPKVRPEWAKSQSPTVIEVFADPISKSQLDIFGNETPEVPPVENKPIQVQTKVKSAKNPNVPVINPLNEKEHTIMQNLGQHVPALAGLMQEGIDTHKKLSEIIAKAGGHPDRGEYLFKPKALNHLPFASRLYSQHIASNRATQEKRDESINDFKQRLQEAKEYLNNPESDEELANIKNERETKKKNALESALKKQAEATARVEAEVPEKLARMKTYTDNLDFIKTLMPYANPLDPKRDPRWYGTGSNDAEQIGTMLHNGVSKENITVGKKIHERMEEGGEIKVTPFERFMQGFGNRHNYDVNSLNEDLKKYAADKGDAFHSEKIEGLRNDLSKIAAEHSNKLQKAQLDMFGGEAPEVPKVPANPSEDRMGNLSVDHKQIYNTLTKKQNSNSITSPERTHLQRFNQYLKGDISHEQLKGYIAYKQNEHHTPLFQNAPEVPKVEAPVPEQRQVKKTMSEWGDGTSHQDKEDHTLSNEEYMEKHGLRGGGTNVSQTYSDHKKTILQALKEGKEVPEKAYKYYLDSEYHKTFAKEVNKHLKNKWDNRNIKSLLDVPQPTVDNVQAPTEMLSEKEFNKKYKAQHKDVRSKTEDEKLSVKQKILNEGFNQSMNVNALPIFKKPDNVISKTYGNKKGDIVYLLPKDGVEDKMNGYQVKKGHKPSPSDIIRVEYDHQPTYEAYKNQILNQARLQKSQMDMFGEEPPNVPKIEAPATDKAQFPSVEPKIDPVEAPKKKFNYEVLKETEKAMHLKIPSWEATHEGKKSHKQLYHELWIPKSVLARGDDYAKDFAFQAKEKIRTSNAYQRRFGKPNPELRATLGEYAPIKEKKTRIVPDEDKAQKMLAEMTHRYNGESLERLSIDGGLSDEDYKLFLALRFTTDHDGKFKNDPLHPMKTDTYYESPLKKSQMDMFGGKPKVDDIQVKHSENFIKPEHELTSDNGTWKLKGDPTATAKMHKWIKDKYNKKEIYTYGGLLQSGHPLADKIKELHGDDKEPIFDHYNKITGRESGKPAGVGETQLRMSMKDGGGLPIGDKHFQVPDLSKEAKIERDSYPNGIALHQALNNGDVSPELNKWHKDYKFNSHHIDKGTISTENPEGKKYERTLYDKDAGNFGSVKQTNEDNLSPEDLEKYQGLKEKYGEEPEFDYTHHDRLNELKEKANKAYPLSDKFSPEDKEVYNRLQEDKDRFTRALQEKGITAKQKEANQEVLDDLAHQESEMHNDYREKLGLHKNDLTGEKGFSYKQELEPEEKAEYEDLKNRKQFSKLHQQYNQPPEEHHISKLLKYPMSSNQKTFDDDHMEEPEENANLFDRNQAQPEPEVPEKMDVSEKINAPKQTKKVKVPQISIEDHFPTVGIRTPGSLQKVGKEYGHRPEDSTKEYKPTSMVDFNGSKYQIQSDGGNYVIAKNLGTGKVDTIAKNDLENYPTDKKVPMVYKQDVEKFMNQQGDKEMPLEDIYSGMKFPDDIKGKEHIKKKIKMALLQLEHNFDPEEGHTPIVNRSIGTPHPKEKDPREKGIMYKLAKSMKEFATQNRIYIKGRNLIKSLMIELYPKEKSIYEKSIESLDILHSLAELKDQEKSLSAWLDNIQAASIKKSATNLLDLSCSCLDGTTNRLSTIQSRFELLKSMDDGSFQKFIDEAVAADEEEEQRTTYRLSKSYMESEAYKNKQIENGNE